MIGCNPSENKLWNQEWGHYQTCKNDWCACYQTREGLAGASLTRLIFIDDMKMRSYQNTQNWLVNMRVRWTVSGRDKCG